MHQSIGGEEEVREHLLRGLVVAIALAIDGVERVGVLDHVEDMLDGLLASSADTT